MDSEHDGIVVDGGIARCWWGASDPDYQRYHDDEWGFPQGGDIKLFEKICLEGFQSGLSWLTILRKREGFRAAFDGFDFHKIAQYDESDVERLLGDANIVRHRKKIESTINNAKRALELLEEVPTLCAYAWSFEPEFGERPHPRTRDNIVSTTASSTRFAKDLKKRGWSYIGPTTAYAFMQAMGIVNDHLEGCHAYARANAARVEFLRSAR